MKQEYSGEVQEYLMYIDGVWVRSLNGDSFEVRNPYNNSLYALVQDGGKEDPKTAVDAPYSAKGMWEETSPAARADYLYRLYDVMATKKDELRDILINESGSTYKKASAEVMATLRMLRSTIEEARRVVGDIISSDAGKFSATIRRPAGVITAITPFNYPLLLSMKKCLPALVVGNTVVLKPASVTPISQLKIAELLDALGLPAGVFRHYNRSGKKNWR